MLKKIMIILLLSSAMSLHCSAAIVNSSYSNLSVIEAPQRVIAAPQPVIEAPQPVIGPPRQLFLDREQGLEEDDDRDEADIRLCRLGGSCHCISGFMMNYFCCPTAPLWPFLFTGTTAICVGAWLILSEPSKPKED